MPRYAATMPNLTELCTSMPILRYISFLNVGLHAFWSNVGQLALAPQ